MKKIFQSILSIFILFSCFITPIHADSGPKPSISIEFKGINEEYYVTLLSDKDHYGPWSKQDEFIDDGVASKNIWEKFNNYEDEFYFIGYFEECTKTHSFHWTYFPPETFKVLIYFPHSDSFVESEITEKYAFDSYYQFNIENNEISMIQFYNYAKEIVSFIVRVCITLAIELLFAYIFSLTKKEHTRIIVLTNIFTQVFLNIGLNIILRLSGYVFLEAMIIVIEGLSYKHFMKDIKSSTAWIYSACANIISFILGTMLWASFSMFF